MHNSSSLLLPHRKGHAKISRLKHKSTFLPQIRNNVTKCCTDAKLVHLYRLRGFIENNLLMLLYTKSLAADNTASLKPW